MFFKKVKFITVCSIFFSKTFIFLIKIMLYDQLFCWTFNYKILIMFVLIFCHTTHALRDVCMNKFIEKIEIYFIRILK